MTAATTVQLRGDALTPRDRSTLESDLAIAEAQVRRLARLRTKTARHTYWLAQRDRLQAQRAEPRQALSLFGIGASP